jgi:hypothetical protein
MEELAKAIEADSDKWLSREEEDTPLRRASINWATTALRAYDGELLKKALGISAAIADFCNKLEDKPLL